MENISGTPSESAPSRAWIYDLLFVVVLLLGAYFRFTGLDWDEGTYLHPDERFLAIVETSIEPVQNFREYWDTQVSSLNPNNRGHGFFVYGTLPIFLVRYLLELPAFGPAGYGEVAELGRPLAGFFDLLTVFLLYLTASRLYNRRVGLLAAAFSSFAVLQIQLSHFFTVDIFANFFIWAAIYFGAVILRARRTPVDVPEGLSGDRPAAYIRSVLQRALHEPVLVPSLVFGVMTGAAAASKISAFPVAFLLPLAAWMYASRYAQRERNLVGGGLIVLMAVSGLLAALTFRVFQPYAFSGPGFFDVAPNPHWLETIGRLQDLVQPSSGYPPSVQWFNRPIWFSGQNLTLWGLGLPLGILGWVGFLWMAWRILRSERYPHLYIWLWVAGHFLWQSTVPNPTMRYQLPIYPGLALMAAWSLTELWSRFSARRGSWLGALRVVAPLTAGATLILTFLYAAGFTQIYRSDVTRIAASRWIYANVPGALNLRIQTGQGSFSQPLPFPNGTVIRPDAPHISVFTPRETGQLTEVFSPHLVSDLTDLQGASLFLEITAAAGETGPLVTAFINLDPAVLQGDVNQDIVFPFQEPLQLTALEAYTMRIELVGIPGSLNLCADLDLTLMAPDGQVDLPVAAPEACAVRSDNPYEVVFTPEVSGALPVVRIPAPVSYAPDQPEQQVHLEVLDAAGSGVLANADLTFEGSTENVAFLLDRPVQLDPGTSYQLKFTLEQGTPIRFEGTRLVQESSWDDPLPMRVDGYDGFGGIYKGDLNLELYWDDTPEKVDRIVSILAEADLIPISSSRQWGSLTRMPERWPLVETYYRELLGCPADLTVEACYNQAEPGQFEGRLGYELTQVFVSNPTIGPFTLNDQASEEAFTVYDHPKVLIFEKTEAFDPVQVREILGAVPLPGMGSGEEQAEPVKTLLLTPEQRAEQAAGGSWSDLFQRESFLNRFAPAAVFVWYAVVFLLGLAVYPLVRLMMPGLGDRGYPFSRTAGLLLLSYGVWLWGASGQEISRGVIGMAVAGLLVLGGVLGWRQRDALRSEWQTNRTHFLLIEVLALALFLFVLLIRIGNPDLWHPWKGGEKPMDFAYFNAVLKSVSFPPYDPWFAGGYINYYYYGFVFVGVLVRWLGIVPSIAYNLLIPTLFMLLGLGAFSLGWNLVHRTGGHSGARLGDRLRAFWRGALRHPAGKYFWTENRRALLAGLGATLGVGVLGNFGTVRMIFQGYQRVAAPPEAVLEKAFFLTRWVWTVRGFVEVLSTQAELPYALADWYWIPSRAIPAPGDVEPITEFPFFTVLYGDLHAHLIALPLTLLALGWCLSLVLGKGKYRSWLWGVFSFLFGGLIIGSLRPTNTWDYPTYLAFAIVAVGTVGVRYYGPALSGRLKGIPPWSVGWLAGLSAALWFAAASWFLFEPYTRFYALGYTDVQLWEGTQTSVAAYLTHWGLFLFVIVSWMIRETIAWLAATPASVGIAYLRNRAEHLLLGLVAVVAVGGLLLYWEVKITFLVLPLAVWAGVLLLRPGMSDAKRVVLFLTGTGLFLTLMVEAIVLSGDIGRMNTVFKFYLQVWVLFGIASAAALAWLVPGVQAWSPVWGRAWRLALGTLFIATALYPLLGGFARLKDRMAQDAPATLDGMTYMQYATYFDQGVEIPLVEDYRAIRWMQENIPGTPVIVEAQVVEYRWGSRYSIYTGLPTVLGWNWHQRQQRTGFDLDVWDRANRVQEFYTTTNINIANRFLTDYGVTYIIVGRLERAYYPGPGLDKFELFEGEYWHEIYRDGQTVIYQVSH